MEMKDMEPNNTVQQTIMTKEASNPEMSFDATDIAFSFAMLICGFLYWNLTHWARFGAGVTVFAAVLLSISFMYLKKSGIRQNKPSILCLGLAALSAVQFVFFDNRLISGLNFIFLSALFVYWVCLSTGRRIDPQLSVYVIGDAINQVLSLPFLNFLCCPASFKGFSKFEKFKGILFALLGFLIFLPPLVMTTNLLVSADSAFENFMQSLLEIISPSLAITYIAQFLFGIPVAFYLYGLIYGNVKGRYAHVVSRQSVDYAASILKIAPETTILSALTAFNILYALFFAVQATYLFSAFNGNLPEAFSYAEYARRGFFELCSVAGINLGLLAVSHLLIKRTPGKEPKVLRIETLLISLFTLLLITTALSKMTMYIGAFGLTQLRVFTSWFMLLLFFIFAIVGVRQLKKFNAAKFVILGFVCFFMVLSYSNVDSLIAEYNIKRFESGTLPSFDLDTISGLSDAAVPHLYAMYLNSDDAQLKRNLVKAICETKGYGSNDFRAFNIQTHRANEIRTSLAYEYALLQR